MSETGKASLGSPPTISLLIVVPNSLKLGGGQEQDILELAAELARGPFRVHVAEFASYYREKPRLTDEAIVRRLGAAARTTIPAVPVLRKLASVPTLRGARRLRDLMASSDIILTCPFYLEDLAISALAHLAHRPLFASQNSTFLHRVRGNPRGALQDLWNRHIGVRLLRSTAGVRTLSMDDQGTLGALGVTRTVVLYPVSGMGSSPNGGSVPELPSVAEAERGREVPPELRVLVAGRMTPQKGIVTLAKVLRQIQLRPDGFSRFRFSFAGTNRLPRELAHYVEKLPDRVVNLGFVPEGLSDVLRRTDVVLMPSLYESLGMAAIEGIRHGVPVIASDVPGLREVVRPGVTGWLAPPTDVTEFVRALDLGLELKTTNPRGWEELRSRCRAAYDQRFGPDAVRAQYTRFVESLRNAALGPPRARPTTASPG